MTNARPDIMGHLLEHTPIDKAGKALLNSDSRFLIGAGRYVCCTTTLPTPFLVLGPTCI